MNSDPHLDDDNLDYDFYYADEEAYELQPLWLSQARGFEDKRTIEAEDFDDLLAIHLPASVLSWSCDEDGWRFTLKDLDILIYSDESGLLSVIAASGTLPRRFLDPAREELRGILSDGLSLFWNATGIAVTFLQMIEAGDAWVHQWNYGDEIPKSKPKGWDVSGGEASWKDILHNPTGVDLLTVSDTAQFLLGKSISHICKEFPEEYRILHIEPVFRNDLVSRFLRHKVQLYEQLRGLAYRELRQSVSHDQVKHGSADDTHSNLAHLLSQPKVTFHGAPRHVISSIVRYGFLVPGSRIGRTNNDLSISHGATYGIGIYSSPDPLYATAYAGYSATTNPSATAPSQLSGSRLLVCATLMGRPLQIASREVWRRRHGLMAPDTSHSHVSPNKLEYVVFDPAAILPCYVLHLDYGAEAARDEYELLIASPAVAGGRSDDRRAGGGGGGRTPGIAPAAVAAALAPGDRQRRQEALKATAAKWFPYGYGPARGTSFVVEEVAEVDEDEEEFGEFQFERIEEETEIREGLLARGGSWFDEYQTVRKTRMEVGGRGG